MSSSLKRTATSETIIASACRITGTLRSTGHVQLEGRLDGDLRSASVTIGKSAILDGSLIAGSGRVDGLLDGDATVSGRLRVSASAIVQGVLRTGRLVIDAGARFSGRSEMAGYGDGRPAVDATLRIVPPPTPADDAGGAASLTHPFAPVDK